MRKVILYAASFFIIAAATAAPGTKLLQRFNETFPNAKNVKWRDDAAGYFVSFTQNGNFNKVFYNKTGNFVYSIKYVDGATLPVNIIMALNKNFGESKIIGVTEVTTQNNLAYNIKLSKDEKLYCLDLSADGSITKQEVFDDASSVTSAQ